MSLFAELRRRNVFRVGAAYAVIAWVILQVTDLAAPALRLPEWVMSLVLFLLLLGFPIALFLAWAYELTPEGLRRAEDAPESTPQAPGGRYDVAIIALLVIAIGLIVHDNYFSSEDGARRVAPEPVAETPAAPAPKSMSIAVMPFINMSDDPEQEHFADGLTEELLNSLAPIEELRVISRTSSFAFKDSDLPLPDIAERLGVDHILEGSVRRAGNRIRITAQLIETTTDSHLWSDTYDEELTVENIFEVQEDIASTVIDALQMRLLPSAVASAVPSNLEALDLYHDALFIYRQIEIGQLSSAEDFRAGEEKFKAAIAADPEWVAPVAMLGRLYHFWSAGGSDKQKLAESRRLIEEVLERDPGNRTALGSLGYILWAEGRFAESLDVYEQARKAGAARNWGLAITLTTLGRFDEAIRHYRLAVAADPLGKLVRSQLATVMQCAGMHEEVVGDEEELLAMFPEEPYVYTILARSYARIGDTDRARQLIEIAREKTQSDLPIADVLALIGEEDRALAAIHEIGSVNRGLVTGAAASLILGDEESGLDYLERFFEDASPGMTLALLCEPEARALAGNPRYDALLESRGLAGQ